MSVTYRKINEYHYFHELSTFLTTQYFSNTTYYILKMVNYSRKVMLWFHIRKSYTENSSFAICQMNKNFHLVNACRQFDNVD